MDNAGKKWQSQALIWVVIIIVLYSIWNFMTGSSYSVSVGVDEEKIGIAISDEDTLFILLEDIRSVELADAFITGEQKSGIDEEDFKYGTFQNEAYGNYTLCYFPQTTSVIIMDTEDGWFVFNQSSLKSTKTTYESIDNMLQNN